MTPELKTATLGAIGGAALAIIVVFGSAYAGLLPASGAQMRAWLLANPQILMDMTNKLAADQQAEADRAQAAALREVGMKSFFDPKVAFVTGPTDAKLTLVEFFDYNCPYCRASIPALKAYYEKHKKDVRFSFIEFPIKGPDSTMVTRASLAARKQPDKYLAYHFAMMAEEGLVTEEIAYEIAAKVGLNVEKLKLDMKGRDIDEAIDISHKLAKKVKIDGTPTFVFNGRIRAGAVMDEDKLAKLMSGEEV